MLAKKRNKYMLQTYGGEFLKQKSETVTVFDRSLTELANDMVKAMNNAVEAAAIELLQNVEKFAAAK